MLTAVITNGGYYSLSFVCQTMKVIITFQNGWHNVDLGIFVVAIEPVGLVLL